MKSSLFFLNTLYIFHPTVTPSYQHSCDIPKDKKQTCGVVGGEESRSTCLKHSGCCYDATSSPKCYINISKYYYYLILLDKLDPL